MATKFILHQMESFQQETEQWKQDHEIANSCWEFEQLLKFALFILDLIHEADIHISSKEFQGELSEDKLADRMLGMRTAYERWLAVANSLMPDLVCFEKQFEVERGNDLKSAIVEVNDILTADDRFFVDDKFVELRDASLDALNNNDCDQF